MSKYKCKCCEFSTKLKANYERHLKTKKHIEGTKKKQKGTMEEQFGTIFDITAAQCKYCGKCFTTIKSMNRHIKYTCKHNNDEDIKELVRLLNEQNKEKDTQISAILEQNKKMQRQIEKLSKKLQVYHIGTQNNTISNKIICNINNYGDTDYSHLTTRDYLKCFKDTNHCVKTLIEKVHLNNEKPENMNIYIPFLKDNYIMVYKNNEWMIQNRKEVIDDLYENNEYQLENWYEEFNEKYPEIVKSFQRYLENKEADSVVNDVKKQLLMEFYNKRNLVLKSKKETDIDDFPQNLPKNDSIIGNNLEI